MKNFESKNSRGGSVKTILHTAIFCALTASLTLNVGLVSGTVKITPPDRPEAQQQAVYQSIDDYDTPARNLEELVSRLEKPRE
jgi:hypothetical protein